MVRSGLRARHPGISPDAGRMRSDAGDPGDWTNCPLVPKPQLGQHGESARTSNQRGQDLTLESFPPEPGERAEICVSVTPETGGPETRQNGASQQKIDIWKAMPGFEIGFPTLTGQFHAQTLQTFGPA